MGHKLAWLAAAGALGTLARYGTAGLVQRLAGGAFPWGTMAVNAVGCLLFGLVWALAEERMVVSGETRTIVLVGFMGAYTTFSTFAFESSQLVRDGAWLALAANVAVHNVLGIVLVFIGMAAGRLF